MTRPPEPVPAALRWPRCPWHSPAHAGSACDQKNGSNKWLPPRKTHRVWQKRRANMVWLYIQYNIYTYIYITYIHITYIHITYIHITYIHITYIYTLYIYSIDASVCVCYVFSSKMRGPSKTGEHRLSILDCRGTNNLSPTWIHSTTLGKNREKHIWLVVSTPLKNMTSSVGSMKFPTEWKNNPNVPNHQPV